MSRFSCGGALLGSWLIVTWDGKEESEAAGRRGKERVVVMVVRGVVKIGAFSEREGMSDNKCEGVTCCIELCVVQEEGMETEVGRWWWGRLGGGEGRCILEPWGRRC